MGYKLWIPIRNLCAVCLVSLAAWAPPAARAQSIPIPPALSSIDTLQTDATRSLTMLLHPAQRERIAGIATATQTELDRSFTQANAAGAVAKVFTPAQLTALAASLRTGQMPEISEDQMAGVAQFMSAVVMKAGPTWHRRSLQVNALLSPQQRVAIDGLRRTTLLKLPHYSFMGIDLASALGDGSPMSFLNDAGSFALLLSLPRIEHAVPMH